MCGFTVLAGRDATAPGVVELGLAALRHRGPDGEGTYRAADGRVAMGHARLAILDLSDAGSQPMQTADGTAVIAFNGEIYNYRQLAADLHSRLRSSGDTAVLLELLRRGGARCIERLRGMFSFAFWDGEELLLVRDRLGIKPLFYTQVGDRFGAASEIGALLAMRLRPREVDLVAVDEYLTYHYVPPPRTGIVGCMELPPGHVLRVRPGESPRVERYWSVPSRAPSGVSSGELRAALEDAVVSHLVSDTPVGVFLSGGLDSSSIVAIAAQHQSRLKTFCVTFGDEGSHLDERHLAKQVADAFGTDHTEIAVEADVTQTLPALVAHFGQPFGNPTAVLSYALSRATARHVKVALAGDGGDEVLGGYPRYRAVWAAEAFRQIPLPLRRSLELALSATASQSAPRGFLANRIRRFLSSSSASSVDSMYYRWVSYLGGEAKRGLLENRDAIYGGAPSADYAFFAGIRQRHGERSMADAAALIDLESFLPHNVLRYGDRMSMAHSLEVRVPLCDHLLVERFAPLPLATKMMGGVQKGLFRWAMRGLLPPRIALHRKVGFNPPLTAWLRGPLSPMVDEYLSEASIRSAGFFDPVAVGALVAGFRSGKADDAHIIWSMVVLEAWRRWLTGAGGAGAAVPPVAGRA